MFNPTHVERPSSLEQALRLVAQPQAIAIAGGAMILNRLSLPFTHFVDLQDIAELHQIDSDNEQIVLGGAARLQAVVESPIIDPQLKQALTRSLPLNIRNGTSVAETLLIDNPPAEWLAMLSVLGASVRELGPTQEARVRPVDDFTNEPERWRAGTILTHVLIPRLASGAFVDLAHVARTPADAPIVTAATLVQMDSAGRVERAVAAIVGASVQPVTRLDLTMLVGNPLDEATIASAVKWIAAQVEPLSDYRGSAEYRREMARVTTRRALEACLTQYRAHA